ncbi:DNA-directed DNA polymerase IV [Aspergillus melleus]|uniref:DNA-directed DNA polymerase IV n=1 Tax=Aspergillus melleus TaxID=138277 RepID=UPI001E8E16CC|nr:uncharacterized protein LDX57_003626 [Aspergillus melleus]KAH8425888.1 hypothetical protein LDX57_003626 [Aspergillus melleus]
MMNKMADKRAFFQRLDQLDCLSDELEDQEAEDFARVLARSRPGNETELVSFVASHTLTSAVNSKSTAPAPTSLTRTRSLLGLQPSAQESVVSPRHGRSDSASSGDREAPAAKTSDVDRPTMEKTKASMSSSIGKRKRKYSPIVVPEQQQIFKGLSFFFFPNNDVSPFRRVRIQRAEEYGARWARSWGDEENITHVIVDKGLTFQDVLKHLKLETFPSTIALVNEGYPAECINFREVLNTTQLRFRVKGVPVSPVVKDPAPAEEASSPSSLPLKPAAKNQQQAPTPSQIFAISNDQVHAGVNPTEEPPEIMREETVLEAPPPRERDALDDMIEEAKAVKDLPLDAPDDETSIEESDSETSEDSSSERAMRKKKGSIQKDTKTRGDWQQNFACMQKHDAKSNGEGPNTRTIEVLQQMLDYYTRTDDTWRVIAYRKAISALHRQSKKVVNRTQARAIPGIGRRLADKIEEIVCTNRLRRLENTNTTPEDLILQLFLGVYGAGVSQASRWVAQGYKTLEDLETKASLSQNQRVGVEHYHDFSQRIQRSEVKAHGEIVRQAVQKTDPEMQVIISGSYRRGAANSGDIDCLITKPDATSEQIRTMMMEDVIPQLFRRGFLQVSLASTSRGDGSKWHGASKLPGSHVWRRIDLLFVPGSEIGAALIYFTGNDIFNRSMRLLARKKGMRLNQRGLYTDVLRGPKQVKLTTGGLLEGRDERRIFEILGVPWRPPEHRIC